MPLNGYDFPVDATWRERVERELAKQGMSRLELAKRAGCSKSLISDLLNAKKPATKFLPEIHAALGWTPPTPPLADADRDELMALYDRLTEKDRQRWIGYGQAIADQDPKKKD